MIEDKLYKALALVLLEPRKDEYGNEVQSPLKFAIEKWANENREDIASAIVKNLGIDELAEKVATQIVGELSKSSSWQTNYARENLNEAVMKKVAERLAEIQIKKLK